MTSVNEKPNSTQVSHTPGPLSVSTVGEPGHGWINGPDGSALATVYPGHRTVECETDPTFIKNVTVRSRAEVQATAERIVRCYNCHDELLAALKVAKDALKANEDITGTWDLYQRSPEMLTMLRAIAKAEGR